MGGSQKGGVFAGSLATFPLKRPCSTGNGVGIGCVRKRASPFNSRVRSRCTSRAHAACTGVGTCIRLALLGKLAFHSRVDAGLGGTHGKGCINARSLRKMRGKCSTPCSCVDGCCKCDCT